MDKMLEKLLQSIQKKLGIHKWGEGSEGEDGLLLQNLKIQISFIDDIL